MLVILSSCSTRVTPGDSVLSHDSPPPPDSGTRESHFGRRDLAGKDLPGGRDLPRPDVRLDSWPVVDQACGPTEIEAEDATKVQQTGWVVVSGGVLHAGQGLEGWSSGASLSFSFYGTDLTVYHETGPNRGTFVVTVDGGASKSVNTTTASFTFQVPVVVAAGLPLATHTAVVVCQSPYCSVDYFLTHPCP